MSYKARLQNIVSQKKELYKAIAYASRKTATTCLSTPEFQDLLQHAVELNILSINEIAQFCRVNRVTVSRWVNQRNSPSSLEQKAILLKIAEKAETLAPNLQ